MRYFLDTEFIESGRERPLELISIGIVGDDGSEFYAENTDCDLSRANEWVTKNVIPHLGSRAGFYGDPSGIAEQIMMFIPPCITASLAGYHAPEFWGYFADYDWVLFCQLFGTMVSLPHGYPQCCLDVLQLSLHMDVPRNRFPKQTGTEHNALDDARWTKEVHDFLTRR